MESNHCKEETPKNEKINDVNPLPSLDRHALSISDRSLPCNRPVRIEIGCLYEIDHGKLPPKSPIQLKTVESPASVSPLSLKDEASIKGKCWSALNCSGLVHWGVRRRVAFVGRHNEKTPRVPSLSSLVKEEVGMTTDTNTRNEADKIPKRRHDSSRHIIKIKAAKHERNPPTANANPINTRKSGRHKLKVSYDRWSKERYKSAEVKMLEIMKERNAVFGKPILRQTLRMEARKHIGDTGLLDHLLKHMSGKVAPNGEERFRRRHNADGAMEYWLESADLVNIRREAGVSDPYWTPPPGWKPGDSPSQDPVCAKELRLLKEEMATIKNELQEQLVELKRRKGTHEEANMTPAKSSNNYNSNKHLDDGVEMMRENYENLVKRKKEMEGQLVEISKSLDRIQEEMAKLASTVEEEARSVVVEKEETAGAAAAAAARAAKRQRLKSGFRICKPQGTFLWPNMGGSAGSHSSNQVVQVEDLLMVPTPPSVSSSFNPPHPTSPLLKPLAGKCADNSLTASHYPHHFLNAQHVFASSPSPHHHVAAVVLPPPKVAARHEERSSEAVGSSSTTVSTTGTNHQPLWIEQQVQGKDTYGSDTWLALATPSPSSLKS